VYVNSEMIWCTLHRKKKARAFTSYNLTDPL